MGRITKKDITLLTMSGLISFIFWVYAPPFTPILIYYGDATYITVQNAGYKQVTDVTIEFDPNHKLTISYINHTKLSGEIITNHTDQNQKIYHISHMYPKDRIFFYVENEEKAPNIDLVVRSNEVEGKPASEYYRVAFEIMTILLIIVTLYFGYQIFSFVKHLLKIDLKKQNSK